jgi:cytochrome c oxidase cbb3-type subunit 4
MDFNDLRSAVTVISFIAFLGIVAWAWSARRRESFDATARLVLLDDDIESAAQGSNGARQ